MSYEIKGKRWKVPKSKFNSIKKLLISTGGELKKPKNFQDSIIWMIKIANSHFALFSNGTLFSYPGSNQDLEIIRNRITKKVGSAFVEPDKEFLIGVDETGVSEIFGNMVISGVLYPAKIHDKLERIVGVANTKKKHNFNYWKELFLEIKKLEHFGLKMFSRVVRPQNIKSVPPQFISNKKIQDILEEILLLESSTNCRIVIDDYGIGENLKLYLNNLENEGASIKNEFHADDNYLEVKTASIVSKYHRMRSLSILEKKYDFIDCPLGSGHPEDPLTINWINKWKKTKKPLPNFVRKSFVI